MREGYEKKLAEAFEVGGVEREGQTLAVVSYRRVSALSEEIQCP